MVSTTYSQTTALAFLAGSIICWLGFLGCFVYAFRRMKKQRLNEAVFPRRAKMWVSGIALSFVFCGILMTIVSVLTMKYGLVHTDMQVVAFTAEEDTALAIQNDYYYANVEITPRVTVAWACPNSRTCTANLTTVSEEVLQWCSRSCHAKIYCADNDCAMDDDAYNGTLCGSEVDTEYMLNSTIDCLSTRSRRHGTGQTVEKLVYGNCNTCMASYSKREVHPLSVVVMERILFAIGCFVFLYCIYWVYTEERKRSHNQAMKAELLAKSSKKGKKGALV